MKTRGLFAKLNAQKRQVALQRYSQVLDTGLTDHVAAFRRRSDTIADPMEKLTTGKEWYVSGTYGLDPFVDRQPIVAFLPWFGNGCSSRTALWG